MVRSVLAFLAAAACVLALAGCPSFSGSDAGDTGSLPVCRPGESRTCACTDGRSGAQACNAARTGFEACVCTGPADGTPTDAAGVDGSATGLSNGVTEADLAGATSTLSVPAGSVFRVNSDNGAIVDTTADAGTPVRAGGEGVISGIGFLRRAGLGVLAAQGLDSAGGASVQAVGARALVVLRRGDARVRGVIDVSAGRCVGGMALRECGGPGGGTGGIGGMAMAAATGCGPGGTAPAFGTAGGGGAFATAGALGAA